MVASQPTGIANADLAQGKEQPNAKRNHCLRISREKSRSLPEADRFHSASRGKTYANLGRDTHIKVSPPTTLTLQRGLVAVAW
ncbi:unnamed protein product, partial [Iphiclides podalirius]